MYDRATLEVMKLLSCITTDREKHTRTSTKFNSSNVLFHLCLYMQIDTKPFPNPPTLDNDACICRFSETGLGGECTPLHLPCMRNYGN